MQKKNIAILGGGNGAHIMAADLKLKGHKVTIFEMPEFKHQVSKLFETKTIKVVGVMNETVKIDNVTSNIDEAVKGADYILVVTPAFAHAGYAELLKGKLNKDQMVILFPGAFGSLVFRKAFGDKDCPILAEANNLPYDTRLVGPAEVKIFGWNKINIGFLPANRSQELIGQVREDLFNFEKIYTDVLESGLSIVNPGLHTGPCLFNISNIERPDVNFFLYEFGFTPSAARLDIALDNERKAVGAAFGYDLTPIEDFSDLPKGYTWQQLYKATHGEISLTPISGPNDLFNRYLTEDAPFGLVPWSSIGELAGVPTPITSGVVSIYNVVHETDWRAAGNTVSKLGLDGMTVEQIKKYLQTGIK